MFRKKPKYLKKNNKPILKIKPIIHHCSTSEVYGQVKPEDVPIKETHKIDPINVYAISKLAQEKLMRSYYLSYDIPVVLTRSFTYINPRRPDIFSSAFARQVVEIEKGKRDKLVYGNLESVRSIIDVRDIVESYWDISKPKSVDLYREQQKIIDDTFIKDFYIDKKDNMIKDKYELICRNRHMIDDLFETWKETIRLSNNCNIYSKQF